MNRSKGHELNVPGLTAKVRATLGALAAAALATGLLVAPSSAAIDGTTIDVETASPTVRGYNEVTAISKITLNWPLFPNAGKDATTKASANATQAAKRQARTLQPTAPKPFAGEFDQRSWLVPCAPPQGLIGASFICLTIETFQMRPGAANPDIRYVTRVYNNLSGDVVPLSVWVSPAELPALTRAVEDQLCASKVGFCEPGIRLEPSYKSFTQYVPTKDTLRLWFNKGTVAPAFAGRINVNVPWKAFESTS
jgi:hypothetical protein